MPFQCIICIETLVSYGLMEARSAVCLPCGHTFHSNCIDKWFTEKLSCPQCRRECKREEMRKLFFDYIAAPIESDEIMILQGQIESLKYECKRSKIEWEEVLKSEVLTSLELKQKVSSLEGQLKEVENAKTSISEANKMLLIRLEQESTKHEVLEDLKNQVAKYKGLDAIIKCPPSDTGSVIKEHGFDSVTLSLLVNYYKKVLIEGRTRCLGKEFKIKNLNAECENQKKRIGYLISEVATLNAAVESYKNQLKEIEDLSRSTVQEPGPSTSLTTPRLKQRNKRRLLRSNSSDTTEDNILPKRKTRRTSSGGIGANSSPAVKTNSKVLRSRRRK